LVHKRRGSRRHDGLGIFADRHAWVSRKASARVFGTARGSRKIHGLVGQKWLKSFLARRVVLRCLPSHCLFPSVKSPSLDRIPPPPFPLQISRRKLRFSHAFRGFSFDFRAVSDELLTVTLFWTFLGDNFEVIAQRRVVASKVAVYSQPVYDEVEGHPGRPWHTLLFLARNYNSRVCLPEK
jgi:hypothetical protein